MFCGATIWMRTRIASLNFVPEDFLRTFRQVSRCRAYAVVHSGMAAQRRRAQTPSRLAVAPTPRLAPPSPGHTLTVASTTPCSSPAGWTLGLRLVVVGSIALRHTPRVGQCSAIGCALVSAEHESMRQRGTPDLQTALHCAHEAVWIVAGMLGL